MVLRSCQVISALLRSWEARSVLEFKEPMYIPTHMYAADTHLDAEKIKKHHSNPSPSKLRKLRRCRLHQSESCTGRAVSWNWCWRWSSHWWIGNGIYGGIPDWRLLGFANPFQIIDFCLIWEEVLIAFPIAIWRETKSRPTGWENLRQWFVASPEDDAWPSLYTALFIIL